MSQTLNLPWWRRIQDPFRQANFRNNRYRTFEQAKTESTGLGYDSSDIARLVVAKTCIYRDEILQQPCGLRLDVTSAFSLASMSLAVGSDSVLRVLDFGGAAGLHYFVARSLLPKTVQIQWVVVEMPKMVEFARPALSNSELSFVTELSEAAALLTQIDVLHSSGAIQYVANPSHLVEQFTQFNPQYLLLNRIGITTKDHHVVTVHKSFLRDHGPGKAIPGVKNRIMRTPFVFASEPKLMRALSEGYRVIARIDDPSGAFPVRGEPLQGIGLLARRCS